MPELKPPPAPMTRLDVFVDAAFAFAITMLVISVDAVPESYDELISALKGTPAFLASFAGIMSFWIGQKSWSKRYGDEDDPVCVILSLILVFLVMVFVYPLKVVTSAMFAWMSGGWLPANFELDEPFQLLGIFEIYGIGFFALAGTLAALYWRSTQRADALGLSPYYREMARMEAGVWLAMALTGVASALWAALLPPNWAIWAGFVYLSLFISTFAVGRWLGPASQETAP
ncbi:MAG: TMEM175 family protein [Pseudomonadota bacterium]